LTAQAVAESFGVDADISVDASGDLDLRGTMGVDDEAPVGFEDLSVSTSPSTATSTRDTRSALRKYTEKYCVVYQTLADPRTSSRRTGRSTEGTRPRTRRRPSSDASQPCEPNRHHLSRSRPGLKTDETTRTSSEDYLRRRRDPGTGLPARDDRRRGARRGRRIGYPAAIKAQVHVGGRGKAGGIKIATDRDEAEQYAEEILGMDLKGYTVDQILVEQGVDFVDELYVGVTMDRGEGQPVLMVSTEGGVNIEEVAEENPTRSRASTSTPRSGSTRIRPARSSTRPASTPTWRWTWPRSSRRCTTLRGERRLGD